MKKTIVILLILVITMVGLFAAADATLKLNTTVTELNGFKVTQTAIGANDTHDFSKFTALATRAAVNVSRDNGMALQAFLTVANNSTTPFSIGIKAGKLKNPGMSYQIGYTVSCGVANNIQAVPVADVITTSYVKALSVAGSPITGINIVSNEISVDINANDFDSATPGDYEGTIYFNIVTT